MEATKLPIRHRNTGPLKLTHIPPCEKETSSTQKCQKLLWYCWWFRNRKQPPGMVKTLKIMGESSSLVVQDFVHQQYVSSHVRALHSQSIDPDCHSLNPSKSSASRASDATCEMQIDATHGALAKPKGFPWNTGWSIWDPYPWNTWMFFHDGILIMGLWGSPHKWGSFSFPRYPKQPHNQGFFFHCPTNEKRLLKSTIRILEAFHLA